MKFQLLDIRMLQEIPVYQLMVIVSNQSIGGDLKFKTTVEIIMIWFFLVIDPWYQSTSS